MFLIFILVFILKIDYALMQFIYFFILSLINLFHESILINFLSLYLFILPLSFIFYLNLIKILYFSTMHLNYIFIILTL
jgi:hypothetical protein